ncbi:MAG: HAD-IA family hydrolase [Candidatus Coproplasma sp.]
MENAFSCALFDLDGTLTDPQEGIINSVLYALNKFGITAPRADLLCFIGPPLVESFTEYFGFSRADSLKAVEYYREYFSDRGIFENKVFGGTAACLARLKESGVKVVLATSKPQVFAERILQKFELAEYFDFVAGATLTEERMNKTQVMRYALENCGETDLSKLIMVGDRKHDIQGAKECGLKSCGVLFGYGSEEELTLAGADYLAADFDQVFDIITKGKTAQLGSRRE